MRTSINCKFCQRNIFVEIDDEYAKLGDPYKLLRFAACDRCADLRIRKRKLEGKIARTCAVLIENPRLKVSDPKRMQAQEILTKLTQLYAQMVAEWHNLQGMSWDEEFVTMLMENAPRWPDILSQYWKQFRVYQREKINKMNKLVLA